MYKMWKFIAIAVNPCCLVGLNNLLVQATTDDWIVYELAAFMPFIDCLGDDGGGSQIKIL